MIKAAEQINVVPDSKLAKRPQENDSVKTVENKVSRAQ